VVVDFEAVSQIAKEYAADVSRQLPVDKAVLFGSYAAGCAQKHSDIDICFFVKSFCGERRVDVAARILGLSGTKYSGAFFEPIVFETAEMHNGNPFVNEILATGIDLLQPTG